MTMMNNNVAINSPFRYAGGKFYARKLILEHIPCHHYYIEPFAGGASIFFAKSKVKNNHLNDLDKELMNVYEVIRDYPEDLIDFLKKKTYGESRIPEFMTQNAKLGESLPATKELHTFFKNEYVSTNRVERAGRWYYLNRTSYSGIMNVKNMYWGYGDKYSMQPKNWAANIKRTSEKLQNVVLTSADFEEIIDNAPDESLLFVDPPYFNADQDKFYTYSFKRTDHYRLAKCLKRNAKRVHIFLTYENSAKIRDLYSWMTEIYDKEWNYCIQRTDDQRFRTRKKGERYKGKELFILNYNSDLAVTKQLTFG